MFLQSRFLSKCWEEATKGLPGLGWLGPAECSGPGATRLPIVLLWEDQPVILSSSV